MQKQHWSSIVLVVLLVVAAAISKVLIYPKTFTPMLAIAVFAGAVIKDKKLAFALPLFAMFLSDLMFEVSGIAKGFWGWGQLTGYAIFALITIIAGQMKKVTVVNVVFHSLLAPVLFYILSNTAYFFLDNPAYLTYTQDFDGYKNAMIAGLPFLRMSILSTFVFSAVLFGSYYGVEKFAFKKAVA